MIEKMIEIGPSTLDDEVDSIIHKCLDPTSPQSFFLYAGAGSGKTRSLVNALQRFKDKYGAVFNKSGQKIAVITYTNAACDEIIERVQADPLFVISTIHSFCWSQIGSFHSDIRSWLQTVIPQEIQELKDKQDKGRAGTKASQDREKAIAVALKRLEWLSIPRRFTYNPNGDNYGMASLSHAEVLELTAHFIITKPSMAAIFINKYPFLLIDESQDTNKHLLAALLSMESMYHEKFALGLFGDMMQRIYADGIPNLEKRIPENWARPEKRLNHRSARRIVQLGNTLRSKVDEQRQVVIDDAEVGIVRLFVVSSARQDKQIIEQKIRERMVAITGDEEWTNSGMAVKTLTLEHHMAASRMGFSDLFAALDSDSRLSTGLKSGELSGIRLFSERVVPVVNALSDNDQFALMSILRSNSPLVEKGHLEAADPTDPLSHVRCAINALQQINMTDPNTTFMDVLKCVAKYNLFEIPNTLKPFIDTETITLEPEENNNDTSSTTNLDAWRAFLETPYVQIQPYVKYINNLGEFGTHQGVKGLEFDRVLVVMDDSEARGFMFSYEKLFGAKPLTENDLKKQSEGEEIGIDRTRRLLYVICTRAKKSLALIAYTNEQDALMKNIINDKLFETTEIELL